jgi:hypothetical protein
MTIKLPRLSSAGPIVNTTGYALVSLTQWWNTVCTTIEGAINTLQAQQTQIDQVLGIANGAAASAQNAQSAAEYALQTGGTITPLTPIASGAVVSNISGVTALPTGNSVTSILDTVFGNAQGSILYRGPSAWQVLAPGTAAQTLHTGGAGANPYWA